MPAGVRLNTTARIPSSNTRKEIANESTRRPNSARPEMLRFKSGFFSSELRTDVYPETAIDGQQVILAPVIQYHVRRNAAVVIPVAFALSPDS
jgi:hypothetical protein